MDSLGYLAEAAVYDCIVLFMYLNNRSTVCSLFVIPAEHVCDSLSVCFHLNGNLCESKRQLSPHN